MIISRNVVFNEDANWKWKDDKEIIVIQVPTDENFQQVQAPSPEVSSPSSPHSSSLGNNSTTSPENSFLENSSL